MGCLLQSVNILLLKVSDLVGLKLQKKPPHFWAAFLCLWQFFNRHEYSAGFCRCYR